MVNSRKGRIMSKGVIKSQVINLLILKIQTFESLEKAKNTFFERCIDQTGENYSIMQVNAELMIKVISDYKTSMILKLSNQDRDGKLSNDEDSDINEKKEINDIIYKNLEIKFKKKLGSKNVMPKLVKPVEKK